MKIVVLLPTANNFSCFLHIQFEFGCIVVDHELAFLCYICNYDSFWYCLLPAIYHKLVVCIGWCMLCVDMQWHYILICLSQANIHMIEGGVFLPTINTMHQSSNTECAVTCRWLHNVLLCISDTEKHKCHRQKCS